MKKMIIIFVVAVFGCIIDAYQNKCSPQKENQCSKHFFEADRLIDEYDHNEEYNSDINEYDQHICDDTKPPKVSEIRAFFEKIVGKLLIHYFTIKGTTGLYFKELKKVINVWINSIIK